MSDTTPPQNPYDTVTPLTPGDEKLWATLVHVGGIFFMFVPSLIGYLLLKDRGPLVRQHTAAALNFQLTMLITIVVGLVTLLILVGFLILAAAGVVIIVFSILAAIAANSGHLYTYPLSIQFVK